MDKDKPKIHAIPHRALENYLGEYMSGKIWSKSETDAMRAFLILRKELKRDVQVEDMKDQEHVRMMGIIMKSHPKKEIAKKMREMIKELGGKESFQ